MIAATWWRSWIGSSDWPSSRFASQYESSTMIFAVFGLDSANGSSTAAEFPCHPERTDSEAELSQVLFSPRLVAVTVLGL
jgi:hypothetical protein